MTDGGYIHPREWNAPPAFRRRWRKDRRVSMENARIAFGYGRLQWRLIRTRSAIKRQVMRVRAGG